MVIGCHGPTGKSVTSLVEEEAKLEPGSVKNRSMEGKRVLVAIQRLRLVTHITAPVSL